MAEGKSTRQRRTLREDFFSEITTEGQAWLLGFVSADGSVTDRALGVALKREDRPTLEAIRAMLGSDAALIDYDARCGGKAYPASRTTFYSERLVRDLARLGVAPDKTHTVAFWQGPESLLPHYARGLVDGDGSVCKTASGAWKLSYCGNLQMVEALAGLVESRLGFAPDRVERAGAVFNVVWWRRAKVKEALRLLYDGCAVALPRKKALADEMVAGDYRSYHAWEGTTEAGLLAMREAAGSWAALAERMGLRVAQVKNRYNRLRRLARGIKG